jgi:uncharacterized HAD superfamily protein
MNFVSFEQLYADMTAWERQLPFYDAVCGVPRSGLIPAAYIALRRNIRLVELSDLLQKPDGAIARATLRNNNPAASKLPGNRLLIVDDASSENSVTFTDLREKLSKQSDLVVEFGAVYRAAPSSKVDHYCKTVAHPRLFGWNWFRNWHIQKALFDMDGVLCEDWKHRPELSNDPEFLQHVRNAKPLFIPEHPIRAIVTSRLERYRAETVNWLARHKVRYRQLIMHPAKTPEARRLANDHAKRKAEAYNQIAEAVLFVESDEKQAKVIAESTGRPVLCTDTMTMIKT